MGLELASSTLNYFLISLFELIFITIALLYFKIKKKNLKEEFINIVSPKKLQKKSILIDILLGLIIGIAFYYIGKLLINLTVYLVVLTLGTEFYLTGAGGQIDVTPPILNPIDLIITILISFIIVGFCEEFFFRGFLNREIGKTSKIRGIILSGVFFSLYHVFPGLVPIQTTVTFFLYYLLMALLFTGLINYRKGNLLSSIIAHGTFNSIIFILNYINYINSINAG